jgi:hypothetical protein
MRIQLILFLILFTSLHAMAVTDSEMQELFKKYDLLMDHKKVELVNDVFSQKFLKETGGKDKFLEKVKRLPAESSKSKPTKVTWKKGAKDDIYFAKTDLGPSKFIIVIENGRPKIDGTISDTE